MARRDRWDRHPEDSFVRGAFSIIDFFMLHKTMCTGVLAVVFGVALGALAYWNHMRSFNDSAFAAFESAKGAEDYRNVVDIYPGSVVEPMALFYRGRKLLDAKQYDEATSAFSTFVSEYPTDMMAPSAFALMGMILEQEKKFEEAVESYRALVERYPASYVAPFVLFSMGGCDEKLDKPDDAKKAYEKIIADYPESSWKKEAEGRMGKLKRGVTGKS